VVGISIGQAYSAKSGSNRKVAPGQTAALKAVVLAGPDPAVDGVVRWRTVDLCRWVEERWGVHSRS